ncbi:MAG: major capsid protein [Microviridae sp.]|nr:MAG: major capsid protein [Microviridae sp.]
MAKPNLLNSIKISSPKKSVFDLSHDVKLSCSMAELVPVMCLEVVPSDRIQCSQEALVRLQPMVAPMMHRCDVSFHTFFVPSRLLWPNFEKFITNQKVAGSIPAFPTVNIAEAPGDGHNVNTGDLADYLGLPLTDGTTEPETVSAMPFAAYQLIWNEYYRDQNNQDETDVVLLDGDNTANADLWTLQKRAWEHDYFTAAAPTAQAGDPVNLPLGTFNDVSVKINDGVFAGGITLEGVPSDVIVQPDTPNDTVDSMYAQTSELQSQSTNINDLRTAFRLQEWLEKSMRGGRRLFENILVFFGLRSPDSRLQRPEYIYGSKSPIQISEVLNTTGTDDAPQGTMAGHGVSVVQPKNGTYNVQEWGYVITIMSVLPRTAYQQGIHRMWLKYKDPMQTYWPQFDHLGEQEIEKRELYAYTLASDDLFGYIPRYAEYKFMNNRVAGEFRTSLDFWHMGRKFSAVPALNADFIVADPTTRVFAVEDPDTDTLLVHVYNKVRAIRPMSKFSTPTF